MVKIAFILAGGLGTRLRPYTLNLPKPLLPLNNVPIIEIVVRQLSQFGFNKIIISLGYLPEAIKLHFKNSPVDGVVIEFVEENEPLGTSGALNLISKWDKNILVMNGDLLTNIDFNDFISVANSMQSDLHVAVAKRCEKINYGVISHDKNLSIVKYDEKPDLSLSVSMGIYAVNSRVLEHLNSGRSDMPDFITKLIDLKKNVHAYPFGGYWQDIGRPSDYHKANEDFTGNPEFFLKKEI
jgi:NDP-sugar pyrophosphorylase family protein